MSPTEFDLITKARSGDARAFGRIYNGYRPMVYGEIRRYLSNGADVEDLVQDTFCRAFEQLAALRQPHIFPSWLRRIAANSALSWLRRCQAQRRLQQEMVCSQHIRLPGPDMFYETKRMVEELRGYLKFLPTNECRALLFYYEGQCTYKEIARMLGVSSSMVKLYLRQGRGRLLSRFRHSANNKNRIARANPKSARRELACVI